MVVERGVGVAREDVLEGYRAKVEAMMAGGARRRRSGLTLVGFDDDGVGRFREVREWDSLLWRR